MATPKKTVRRIWTIGHRPFVMGGAVYYVMACDVECSGPHDLGGGYAGYLARAPNGRTYIAEAKSGAIVGSSLRQVRADIKKGDPSVVRKQVREARVSAKDAEIKTAEFFWHALARC